VGLSPRLLLRFAVFASPIQTSPIQTSPIQTWPIQTSLIQTWPFRGRHQIPVRTRQLTRGD
jgi:hypothetical protein